MLILFLPARSSEWNPIELVWNLLEQRLRSYDWSSLLGSNGVIQAATCVQNDITHELIYTLYENSRVFYLHGHR